MWDGRYCCGYFGIFVVFFKVVLWGIVIFVISFFFVFFGRMGKEGRLKILYSFGFGVLRI